MISIYQIYFDDTTKSHLDAGFIPYFNEKKDGFFENTVIKEIYEKLSFPSEHPDYIGISSWKQRQKTNLKGEEIISHIQNEISQGAAKDVYLYTHTGSLLYSYNDVPDGYYCNGIIRDIDIWEGHKNRGKEVSDLDVLLNNSKVLPFDLYDGKWQFCYGNYWVVKTEIFYEYCEKILLPALAFFQREDIKMQSPSWYTHSHEKKKYPSYSFTFEGLFGAFLAHSNYSFSYIVVKREGGKFRKINIIRYENTTPRPVKIQEPRPIILQNDREKFEKILKEQCKLPLHIGMADDYKIEWRKAIFALNNLKADEKNNKIILKNACGIPVHAVVGSNTKILWKKVVDAMGMIKGETDEPIKIIDEIPINIPKIGIYLHENKTSNYASDRIRGEWLADNSEKKIIGFWHICMINNFYEIISEQLELMVQSGLYNKSENIFVGCTGEINELEKVKKLFNNYYKIKILLVFPAYNYEFPTLESIKYKSDTADEFYLFYIHTKGVSYPDNKGGKYWRDYMNYFNITKWKDAYLKLKQGYNTCGVKLIEKREFPMHYSGNFWWANSGYVKTLPEIDTLNKKDRFSAEMWLCSKSPKAFSLCQNFVDYNIKGKFVPEKSKIIVHTLGFNLSSEIKETTRLLYEQNKQIDFTHVIVDLGFPLLNKDEIPENSEEAKSLNAKENLHIANTYNSKFIVVKNIGVSQNWDFVRRKFDIKDDDILICADPDERPKTNEWVKAIRDVINGDNIAWCSLLMKEQEPLLKNMPIVEIGKQRVYLMNKTISWAQGGFSGRFLNEIGGVPVPNGAPIYGWIETICCEKMNQLGYKWAILADYYVEHTECSPLYRAWKTQITSNVKDGQIDFEIWLKKAKIWER